jgi:hypothetical protein
MPFGRSSRWAACWLLLAAGCGSDEDELNPVRGTVYYHNVPLTQGTIVFSPDTRRGGHGELARAEIQRDGSFVLKTGDKFGAAPGWHRVTVVAVETSAKPSDGWNFAEHRTLVPLKYRDPELSNLEFEVKPGIPNTADIRLTD